MLIAYSMPAVTDVSFTGSPAGMKWLTSDGYAALFDARPARPARLQWQDSAAPVTGDYVAMNITFAAPSRVRIVGLLGLRGVGAGVVVRCYGRYPGGSYTAELGMPRTTKFADGTVGVWLVIPEDLPSFDTIQIWLLNDRNGAVWANAQTIVDIGEIVAMPAVDIPIDAGWGQTFIDPTDAIRGRASQVSQTVQPAYRELAVAFSMAPEAAVRYGGLLDGMDWERLATALAGRQRCVAIPRWKGPAGTVDATKVQAHAMYGIASEIGETRHMRGPWWSKTLRFEEIPAVA